MQWLCLNGWGNSCFGIIGILIILFCVIIIIGLIYLLKSQTRNISAIQKKPSSEILKEQHTKGKITDDE
jgi:uncharacterized membrane protein